MTWFFGLVSLLWVIDHAVAIYLSFPKGMHWLRALRIEGRRASLKRLFDSHRAWGLWFLPVTLVLAVTGVTLSWPDDSREAVGLLSPVTGRLHETMGDVPESPAAIGIDEAVGPDRRRQPRSRPQRSPVPRPWRLRRSDIRSPRPR